MLPKSEMISYLKKIFVLKGGISSRLCFISGVCGRPPDRGRPQAAPRLHRPMALRKLRAHGSAAGETKKKLKCVQPSCPMIG